MATVSYLMCPTEDGAEKLFERLFELKKQGLIQIDDAAIVTWSGGAKRPRTRQLTEMSTSAALDGAFWGTLFGAVFFMPLAGAVAGAALGAIRGALADYGINDSLIEEMRRKVTEGTSALFLVSKAAVIEKIAPALKDIPFEISATTLSAEQEQKLRSAFGHS
jgi:uncharacterized membrane protein